MEFSKFFDNESVHEYETISKQWISGHGESDTGRILFKENSSFIICGRSGSGKTTFIFELLKNIDNMFTNEDNREIFILYCYGSWQPMFDLMKKQIPNIYFYKGLPDEDEINKVTSPTSRHLILVVDDLMSKVISSQIILDYFTVKAHHQGTSVLYVSHNLFQQGKFSRAISLNAGYFILFQNPRGADQVRTLSSQIYPGRNHAVVQAYKMAMEVRPYSYLVIDMTANVPEKLRMRTCIMPHEVTRYYALE